MKKEAFPFSSDSEPFSREKALNAYKKFVDRGITNPDDLDLDDPEVKEANELFNKWQEHEDHLADENDELKIRANLLKTMFYVDAGFADHDYLDEVLNEWLIQDAQYANKEESNEERKETRRQIAEAMKKIRSFLGR